MKKRTIKFAGWAFGLAMMVGFIGAASFAFGNGSQNAIAAYAEDGYTKVASYDFSKGNSSTSAVDAAALKTRFADSASNAAGLTDIVSAVSGVSSMYSGYNNYLNFGIKFGTSSYNGTLTLTTTVAVSRAVVVAAGWSATDSVSVGGADAQVPGVAYNAKNPLKTLTFDFSSSTSVDMVFSKRGFVQSIEFYTGEPSSFTVTYDGNGGAGSVEDDTEYKSGDEVTIKENAFTRGNYASFSQWNTKADGSGIAYDEGATFNITQNVKLYAIWAFDEVELGNGSYNATLPYVNPIPGFVDVESNNVAKASLEVAKTDLGYDDANKEYVLSAKTGKITFFNHTNAVFTKVVVNIYNYDNYTIYADGTSVHEGDYKSGHDKIELDVEASSTIVIQNTSTYSSKLLKVELFMRVGNEEVHPTGVELNATSGDIFIGKSRQLTASVLPLDADDRTVTWSTSDHNIATVDENGLVTGVAAGNVTITATTNDGGLEASFAGTVKSISYGTSEEPLTVEQAYEVLESENPTTETMYVKGRVNGSSYDSQYNNYIIWLESSDGVTKHFFELYHTRLRPVFGADTFTATNALAGMTVVASGLGKVYNGTPELADFNTNYPYVEAIEMSAEQFANAMIADTQSICDGYATEESSAHRSSLSIAWDSLSIKYGCVADEGKDALINATANPSGTIIEKAVARYDFLAAKYQFDAFIVGRSPISLAQNVYSPVSGGNATWAIALAGGVSVGVLAVGTFIALRKKKQD